MAHTLILEYEIEFNMAAKYTSPVPILSETNKGKNKWPLAPISEMIPFPPFTSRASIKTQMAHFEAAKGMS